MSPQPYERLGESVTPGLVQAQEWMARVHAASPHLRCLEYETLEHQAIRNPELTAGLIEYAGDDSGPAPLLLRSLALEAGLGSIRSATGDYPVRPLSDEEQRICEQTQLLVPEYFSSSLYEDPEGPRLTPDFTIPVHPYGWFFAEWCRREGISVAILSPDAQALGYDPSTVTGNMPVAAGMLVQRMMRAEHPHDIAALPPRLAEDAFRAALDFRGSAYQAAIAEEPSRLGEFARLARFTERGGYEHDEPLKFLYNLPGERGLAYARTLNRLYDALAGLSDVFPESVAENVVLGARGLVANALFAVAEHLRAGEYTDETLRLLGGHELSVAYEGSEPLAILQRLSDILSRTHRLIVDPDTHVSLAVREQHFAMYDFRNAASGPLRAVQYIRPEGGFDCNYRYEYGGRRRGVQASIDLRIDEGGPLDPRRPYHRSSMSPDGISIRLDREGREPGSPVPIREQNPTQEAGTISLDIGSVMGEGFGGRAGRFLAWGNMLRSRAADIPQSLNHATEKIDQQYGGATAFRRLAIEAASQLEARRHASVGSATATLAIRAN